MSQCIKVLRFYKIFQCEHSTIESMRELVILEEIMDKNWISLLYQATEVWFLKL